ncbi:DUF86 domain-containing protein [Alteribacter natronophilus]|uniref:DUF86 domain-containing protein n=1 Tax=Alteribacter natronophilus TaxID=2583810 RepID=UPI00110F14A4|nr:DUF86 domain-containing protein [Alteribacter natronophilus]TMW72485.1 DUF86 domain-containing protein [Alteribacter natronophilus]
MYFVDRELIEKRLAYLEKLLGRMAEQTGEEEDSKLVLERTGHMIIEAMMDTSNQMIDGFIMRDPGSFEDIVDILLDEKVVSDEEGQAIKRLLPWRKTLLQEYTAIDHQKLKTAYEKEMPYLLRFPGKIRMYLENELGPVSAFLPHKTD